MDWDNQVNEMTVEFRTDSKTNVTLDELQPVIDAARTIFGKRCTVEHIAYNNKYIFSREGWKEEENRRHQEWLEAEKLKKSQVETPAEAEEPF